MPIPRPTASTITDDQLDALWDALDLLEALHQGHDCETLTLISRQRSRALETPCRSDPDPHD